MSVRIAILLASHILAPSAGDMATFAILDGVLVWCWDLKAGQGPLLARTWPGQSSDAAVREEQVVILFE